mmetsp:Transcript_1423/g.3644  ORF Transcript_1423/g.3644 Transcript_1423/m.3644 type:complete len:84 (-) Transcript_1423:206-457(-)
MLVDWIGFEQSRAEHTIGKRNAEFPGWFGGLQELPEGAGWDREGHQCVERRQQEPQESDLSITTSTPMWFPLPSTSKSERVSE